VPTVVVSLCGPDATGYTIRVGHVRPGERMGSYGCDGLIGFMAEAQTVTAAQRAGIEHAK
jgi:hypothetical protein